MWKDIGYAVRMLMQAPAFSAIAILTLAIGIGFTAALFSVMNGVLFRPLPYQEPDRLTILWENSAQRESISVSYQNFIDWRDLNTTFKSMAAFRIDDFNLTGHGEAKRARARMVSANFFSTLGIQPVLGRDFRTEEDRLNAAPVAILSYKLWNSTFQRDPSILGQSLEANDRSFTIIGIMPENFHFFTEVDFFVPIGLYSDLWPSRDNHPGIYVIGRLRTDSTVRKAQTDLDQIAKRLQKQYPETNAGKGIIMESLAHNMTSEARPAILLLFAAVVFVLLIACANVANMMLARGMARQKEMSIRMALGAGRFHLIRQSLLESLLLSFAGGMLGLLLAHTSLDILLWLRPANLPRLHEIKMDWMVLAFSFFLSVFSAILFGLLPAFQSSSVDLQNSIKEAGAALPTFRARYKMRHALVVSQVAFSLLLLIGAGLMTKSILRVLETRPGFETDRVLTVQLSLSRTRYQGQKVLAYLQEAQRRIEAIPGIQSVAYTNGLPIAGANEGYFWIEGRPKPRPGEEFSVVQYYVSPNYLQTLNIPLLKGRYLLPSDRKNQPFKLVIDEALANKYFQKEDAIGKWIRLSDDVPPAEIVGIAGHVKHYGLDVAAPVEPQFYLSVDQIPDQFLSQVAQDVHFVVRTAGAPEAVADSVLQAFRAVDPQQPVSAATTMNQLLADSFATRRFSMILLSAFALVALFLAAAGIYGVLSYTVAQRSREIGIRMAVGARKTDVLKLFLSGGFRLIFAGLILGIAASLALSRVIASQLYAVSPTDPATFILISAVLAAVGLAATYLPASRATKIDPVSILKYE